MKPIGVKKIGVKVKIGLKPGAGGAKRPADSVSGGAGNPAAGLMQHIAQMMAGSGQQPQQQPQQMGGY